MNRHRVKFFSIQDLAYGWQLRAAETILREFDVNRDASNFSVDDIIELHNIGQYFKHDICLKTWTEEDLVLFRTLVKNFPPIIGRFFSSVTNDNFVQIYLNVDFEYKEDFLYLLSKYKATERITQEAFSVLLENENVFLSSILCSQDIVRTYGSPIRASMLTDNEAAELLLDKYEIQRQHSSNEIYLPIELTLDDKEAIIIEYIKSHKPNLNYLRLITNVQSSKDKLRLSPETLLSAKRRAKEMEVSLFENSSGMGISVEVSFSESQKEYKSLAMDGLSISASYSTQWIWENLDFPTIMNNFIYMFEYVDIQARCTLVNHFNQMGVFERFLFMESKNAYRRGAAFDMHHMLSLIQIKGYHNALFSRGIRLESVIEWFFMDYLKEEFGILGFYLSMPSQQTLPNEKCTFIMPAMEYAIKQFAQYVNTGTIDHELLGIRSEHLVYDTILSLCEKKYVYGIGNEYNHATFLLFSDQGGLGYQHTKHKSYENFYELLKAETAHLDEYADLHTDEIQWLLDHGFIFTTETNEVYINEPTRIRILFELFHNDVVSYWKYPEKGRAIIDDLAERGLVEFESTLLTRPESDYFNYYLNKAKFNNGPDLRNKYSHTQPQVSNDGDTHSQNYLTFLRLFIIVVIKINDDICTRDKRLK